jgi:glycosyltransferase involved in cell wall biosynthesis
VTFFSIVLPALNEGPLLEMTVESIARETRGVRYEILVVDDGSVDGCADAYRGGRDRRVRLLAGGGLGVAGARNLGARHARGDHLVFMDAHCRVQPDWLARFAELLCIPSVAIVGPCFTRLSAPTPRVCGMYWPDDTLATCWFDPGAQAAPYGVPLTPGGCQAFRRATFDALGGYEGGFAQWGFEDVEICLRAWLLGFQVVAHPGVTIAHHFRESRDNYDVDDVGVTYNFLRLVYLHFAPTRIRRVLRAAGGNGLVNAAQDRLFASDVFDRRAALLSRRVRDDAWFFAHVNRAGAAPIENDRTTERAETA